MFWLLFDTFKVTFSHFGWTDGPTERQTTRCLKLLRAAKNALFVLNLVKNSFKRFFFIGLL